MRGFPRAARASRGQCQRKAVQAFADAETFQIVGEYVEVEIGKGADALDRRPQLKAALVEAKRASAQSWSPSSTGCPATSSSSRA